MKLPRIKRLYFVSYNFAHTGGHGFGSCTMNIDFFTRFDFVQAGDNVVEHNKDFTQVAVLYYKWIGFKILWK